MALTLLGRRYDTGIMSSVDFKTGLIKRSHTVSYFIKSTDCDADESTLLETPGLPKVRDESDIFPGLLVESIDLSEGDGDGIWTATVNYVTPEFGDATGGGGKDNQKPWEIPFRISYDTMRKPQLKTRMIFIGASTAEEPTDLVSNQFPWTRDDAKYPDGYGNYTIDVTNSAGDPIYYDGERSIVVCNIEFSTLPNEMIYWLDRVNTVNDNYFFLSDEYPSNKPGTLYMDSFTSDRKVHVDSAGIVYVYYDCKARVAIDPYGHWVEFADVGNRYFDGFRSPTSTPAESKMFRDEKNEPTIGELNGRGGPKASYEGTFFLKYVPYPVYPW